MSNTDGRTAAPPVNGTLEIFTLMPPVEAYAATPWSWYCQRLARAGCQHGVPVHGLGAGGAAWATPPGAMLPAMISPSTNSNRTGVLRSMATLPVSMAGPV